jgi:hydrogenase nickel incorporation protein HypA/HybF
MHELGLGRAIVDGAVRFADGHRVVKVAVTIGVLRHTTPESIAQHFEIAARGTLCEGAVLEPRFAPARLRCACGEEWEAEGPPFICPRCGGGETTVLGGEELSVDSIEVEE